MDNTPDHCRVATTMEMIIGKWKIAIMLNLIHYGTMRFSELRHVMPGVTQKVLTSQLRDLEQEGIVKRVVYPQVPPKVEYSMTEYGMSLQTILEMMHEWGKAHLQRKTQMLFSKDTDNQNDKNN
ncbi:helix-turn-helix domain-containing protein [Neobacillus mesonae]|uniref:winged helix-turn-helix transcriptional regulator n=1 Tax=Neobacillus mesonae TaxID=1193713 RepID=UPI00203C6DB1|nr:winged helix-turn-helix transcriptional regulator [Neobacillus mesonae]MCM3571353.1 winged helix-turn-helix transcriptional regulator [Neobacillus mesonae]